MGLKEYFMRIADTYVRVRISSETKERASEALEAMGLSISEGAIAHKFTLLDPR